MKTRKQISHDLESFSIRRAKDSPDRLDYADSYSLLFSSEKPISASNAPVLEAKAEGVLFKPTGLTTQFESYKEAPDIPRITKRDYVLGNLQRGGIYVTALRGTRIAKCQTMMALYNAGAAYSGKLAHLRGFSRQAYADAADKEIHILSVVQKVRGSQTSQFTSGIQISRILRRSSQRLHSPKIRAPDMHPSRVLVQYDTPPSLIASLTTAQIVCLLPLSRMYAQEMTQWRVQRRLW